MNRDLIVRAVSDPIELRSCAGLYREVFEIPPEDAAITHRLLASIQRHSGTVTGAFVRGRLVGFTYSFLARDKSGRLYHYSQLAVVASANQGQGIGRALKLGQRSAVLADGIRLVRWSFDPLHARNAHFNLDVLGAVGRGYCGNLYGLEAAGGDVTMATPRLLVDWDLAAVDEPTVSGSGAAPTPFHGWVSDANPGDARQWKGGGTLVIPLDWAARRREDVAAARALQRRVGEVIETYLAEGLVAVSCRKVSPDTAAYLFSRDGSAG